MQVLTIANRKGGAGKSTCAAHLAIEASNNGYKTIIIDMDPQKTLENWWQKRTEDTPTLLETTAIELPNSIEKLKFQGFDLCIIDTPGDSGDFTRAGIMAADLVIIPSKPTPPDLSAIGRTISLVEESKKKFAFVITQGIVRTKATLQALSVLSQFGAVAPAPISNRTAYASAMGAGKSAGDFDKLAQEEIVQVWGFIKEILFKSEKVTKQKLIA
jgi:chromosome partitioning protein